MVSKINKDVLDKMVAARTSGKTYKEIESELGVSRWASITYLKDIQVDKGVSNLIWKQAETKAGTILKERGYTNILNLNRICPSCYFDYYCTKGNQRWLVDVTINESKDLASKSLRLVDDFVCAILYLSHDLKTYRLVKLQDC